MGERRQDKLFQIYCINLKERPDRWNRFVRQPGFQRLVHVYPFERFEGVNGKKLDVQHDDRVSLRTKRNILYQKRRDHEDLDTAGGVGCYLSHYGTWQKFLQTDATYCLIFEDDAELTENVSKLHEFYEEACALEPKWDILVLGATEWVDSTLASPTIRKPTRFWGTHALLLNRKAAQAALDTHKRLQEKGYAYPADWFYSATILQNNLVAYGPRNSKLIQQKPGLVSAISGKVRR